MDRVYSVPGHVDAKLREVRPRTVVYLFSAGKDSSLALLLTRDYVRRLCEETRCRVYILYVLLPGNTHPLNAYAASAVMEWHRKHYGFEPIYRCVPLVFQELVARYGLQVGSQRWCFIRFKDRVFRGTERQLPRPQIYVDGMSPSDSKARERKVKTELEFVETADNTRYWAWHPLFSLNLSSEEKLRLLRQHPEFTPVVELYEVYGDSLNCVLCPYKSVEKLLKHHAVEDLSALYHFTREVLRSGRWRRRFSKLANRTLGVG